MTYSSIPDTQKHISVVRGLIGGIVRDLLDRSERHDLSKLESPEVEVFDEFTPKLKDTTYGSPEYKEFLKEMKVGLDHHYKANRHHPEHFPEGINAMNLLDLIEMFCDWYAASQRHADGDIMKSIDKNKERFGISKQLEDILKNTALDLGWET